MIHRIGFMDFYLFSKVNVYKKMDHSMDAKQLLPLGIKIGKFGSYFREFATDSHEALHKIFIKNFAR